MTNQASAGRRVLFAAILFVALCLFFEVAVRIVLPPRSFEAWRSASLRYVFHPEYHWALKPGVYPTATGKIPVNRLGLRDDGEIPVAKEEGELRIVVLGGSSTFNYHAGEKGAWPDRLEERLALTTGRPVRVLNAGTPGYSTLQSARRLESQLIDFNPDWVLVYHLWNDLKAFGIEDADEMMRQWVAQGRRNGDAPALRPSPFWDFLSRWSQTVSYARFAKIELGKRLRRRSGEGFRHPALDREVTKAGVDFFRSNLERIAEICAEHGAKMVIVDQLLLANEENSESERAKIQYEFVGFAPAELWQSILQARSVMRSVAKQTHVYFLETTGIPADEDHLADHVHLTERGLDALASRIAEGLTVFFAATGTERGPHRAD